MTTSSTKVKPKKKIGRPVEIAAVNFVGVKLPTALLEAIDAWAATNEATRSQAIRQLVERGLATDEPSKSARRVKRAASLSPRRSGRTLP